MIVCGLRGSALRSGAFIPMYDWEAFAAYSTYMYECAYVDKSCCKVTSTNEYAQRERERKRRK